MKWRVRNDTRLFWRNWHQESLIFDELSGDTHLFDYVSATGLKLLEQEWHTVESLAAELADKLETPATESFCRYADQLIEMLAKKGILQSSAADSS
jgi:PqqD family protein of HPr-rel-A system